MNVPRIVVGARRRGARWAFVLGGVVTGVLLAGGCTVGDADDGGATPPASRSPATPSSSLPAAPASPTHEVEIEFTFEKPTCAPVTVLTSVPIADEGAYAPSMSNIIEGQFGEWRGFCHYKPADRVGGGKEMVLADHVVLAARTALYREWEDSGWFDVYRALPVMSADLDDWMTARMNERDAGVVWEGCGHATPCGKDEEPTVRMSVWDTRFVGHVGNLEFDVTIQYLAQRFPHDVTKRCLAIFRDLVLATIETMERRDR